MVCDTGSKGGVLVNGKKISGPTLVRIGDAMTFGSVTLSLYNTSQIPERKRRAFQTLLREAASPFRLMMTATLVHLLIAFQAGVTAEEGKLGFQPELLLPELGVLAVGWGLYAYSIGYLHRVSFEIETVGYLLSGIGINLLAAFDLGTARTQLIAMILGVGIFCFLIWFMNDLDRVAKYRLAIGIGALCLFVVNLLLGTTQFGSKNWKIGRASCRERV